MTAHDSGGRNNNTRADAPIDAEARCQCCWELSIPSIPADVNRSREDARHAIRSLLRGAFFSLIGSSSLAALWVCAALVWQMEIGWMAWGLGALAGLGMAWQNERANGFWAGILAVTITLSAILASKSIVFLAVVLPILRRIEFEGSGTPTAELFFSTMLAPIDSLFIGLALVTAYVVGSHKDE